MKGRRILKPSVSGVVSGTLILVSTASAHINTNFWSLSGHTLQSGTNSNMVGFWQTLGSTKICVDNGVFNAATVTYTKRMQAEVAYPPIAQTGIVNTTTWNAIQGAVTPPDQGSFARLVRDSGAPPNGNGFFHYYNGEASDASLYWQGTNTGTGLWKFRPLATSTYYLAETALTMPALATGC
jgi:hypothetical protein